MGSAAWLFGLMAAALALGVLDAIRGALRMPEAISPLLFLGTCCVSTAALLALALPVLWLRSTLRKRTGARASALAQCGAFFFGIAEAALLCGIGLLLEDLGSLSRTFLVVLSAVIALLSGVASLVVQRWPRLVPWACVALALSSILFAELLLPFREKPQLRLSLDLVFLAASASLLGNLGKPALTRLPNPGAVLLTVVVLIVGLGFFTYTIGSEVRSNVQVFTPHAQAFLNPLASALRLGPLSRNGNVRCGTQHARPRVMNAPSSLAGAGQGADILWISIDALRWDQTDGLAVLLESLGDHVRFTRAVSPAPRTMNSLAAVLRGVPARQVAYDRDASDEVIAATARPTIAAELHKLGYRTVHIPTHRYFEPRRRVNAGFEAVLPDGFDATVRPVQGKRPIVSADAAIATARRIAIDTKQPLFLWLHLMESHEPYRWHGGEGPESKRGQLRAIRHVAERAAALVRFMRATRAPRPLIVAVFGDHGEEFGEHGGSYHSTSVFAEQVRVGMAVSAPGILSARIDAPTSAASLPATMLELLGQPEARSFSEPSLLPCIERRDLCPRLAVSQMLNFGSWVGYTGERFRLMVDPAHGIRRLYDSTLDPFEKHDLSQTAPEELGRIEALASDFDAQHCVD